MNVLNFTLLSEGSSDEALVPHLIWLLKQNEVKISIQPTWADLRLLPKNMIVGGLANKIKLSLELYPCDLLFIHHDADRESLGHWKAIIDDEITNMPKSDQPNAYICVIPVRMQESWMLFDENAIRRAAGNPHGTEPISLPKLRNTERVPDPKSILHENLKAASGRNGRRLNSFNVRHSARLVSEYIEDFSPLRNLRAFQQLEVDLKKIIDINNWNLL
jgi:hypothetical protein